MQYLLVVAWTLGGSQLLIAQMPQFRDSTESAGLEVVTWSGRVEKPHILESTGNGVLVLDYDGDGFEDMLFVSAFRLPRVTASAQERSVLYRNLGSGRFTDVTEMAGIDLRLYGHGGCVGDANGDGLPDVYVTNYGPNVLYLNNGDGSFSDATEEAGVGDPRWSIGATFFDADGDGDQDLYVGNYLEASWDEILSAERTRAWRGRVKVMDGPRGLPESANIFYLNNGDGTFTDATERAGMTVGGMGYSMGVVSLQEAVEVLGRSVELAPGFAPSRLERARARLLLGKKNAALDDLLAVIAMPELTRDTKLRTRRLLGGLALEAERREDLWQAMEIYQKLLDSLGSAPAVEMDVARVAQSMGAAELAFCAASHALAANSENASVWYLLAAIEADRGNTDAAIEASRRSLQLGSEDVRVWLRLGELYFEQMKISESIAAYREAMTREPGAAEAVRSFALSSLTTEQNESLRILLESHIETYPDNLNTLYSLGVMSLRDNRLEEAEEYLLRLAELTPDHRQVHYSLGQIYLRRGDTARGQAEMDRFAEIKLAEDRDWNTHNQAHFRRVEARKALAEGRPEEAIPLYEQSVAEETAELSDYLELAEASMKAGRADQASRWYKSVLSSFPYHRDALQGLLAAASELQDDRKRDDALRKLEILDWTCEPGDA